ncbi:MAG TPA: sugar phosphate nucleotidyltransferase [Steroidobacteraceae bacterium]
MNSKRAIILAGGRGTRLRPYTVVLPKPLMPIGEYPILEVIIRQLAHAGFSRITLAVNHQAELIKAFFGDGSKWKIKIDYSLEESPLGTMGPLRLIRDLPEDFLVMNGDILSDIDYGAFHAAHVAGKNLFTISSHVRQQMVDYGVLEVGPQNTLVGFREKPKSEYQVSMGIYMVSRNVLEHIPGDRPFGFDNLMLDLIKAGKKVAVQPFTGYWLDIGRPDDYAQAIEQFEAMRTKFLND